MLVDRLEERLDRLEDTHREVLAAAYENVAGTNQVHRACLALLEPVDFAGFLAVLTRDVAPILGGRGDPPRARGAGAAPGAGLGPEGPFHDVVVALPAGGVDAYVTQGRGLGARRVTLRQLADASPDLYGAEAPAIRSEALIRLDLGDGHRAGSSPSAPPTRRASTPTRAPTSSPSSAASSSAACGAGWHDRSRAVRRRGAT